MERSRPYDFREALLRLGQTSSIKHALAGVVAATWTQAGVRFGRVMDIGGGDGMLLDAVLTAANVPSVVPISFVEPDSELRAAATERFGARAGPVTASAGLPAGPLLHSHVLASHVAYYVDDVEKWISRLSCAASSTSVMTIVVRSERCDSRRLRDVSRAHAGVKPRLSPATLVGQLQRFWPSVEAVNVTAEIEFDAELPLTFAPGPSSSDLEQFVRWMSNLGQDESLPVELVDGLNRFLSSLQNASGTLRFHLEDASITGVRDRWTGSDP